MHCKCMYHLGKTRGGRLGQFGLGRLKYVENNVGCSHKWNQGSRSDDHPCKFYNRYPQLKFRYQCSECLIEACTFCLENQEEVLDFKTQTFNKNEINELIERKILRLEENVEKI